MRNTKLHLTILAIIIVTLTLLFYVLGLIDFDPEPVPEPTAPAPQPSISDDMRSRIDANYQITIWEATWGRNCDSYVDRMVRGYGHLSQDQLARRNITIPQKATANNALSAVSKECNGLSHCSIEIEESTFETPSIGVCSKELVVYYRCFDIDRRREAKAMQGGTLELDCRGK
tara:strand:- start:91 stop:609 length:519 start_codon:yes stop_codon:yes gene_type:complete